MRFRFTATSTGYVEVDQSEDMSLFIRVLNDCIGSRAPRGAPPSLSTYWIDEALKEFRPHLGDSEASAIFSGNASYLELVDGLAEARFDYDPPDSDVVDRLPLQDLVDLLGPGVLRWSVSTQLPPPGCPRLLQRSLESAGLSWTHRPSFRLASDTGPIGTPAR